MDGDLAQINLLSPSEKYDLLLGTDSNWLSNRLWQVGKSYYDKYGSVEKWMGLCHGWAAAAFREKRPLNAVRLPSADGKRKITFYLSDIRGLLSLNWANNKTTVRFIGGRCGLKKIDYDPNGRILNKECFDVNPGTWHSSVVNQLGVNKKALIIDVFFDYEVWNQPVYYYHYKYFNPQTLAETSSLQKATVSMNNFTRDKFRKFRSRNAVKVVGVDMRVDYTLENRANQTVRANPQYDDVMQSVHYIYDLELDGDGNIVGGEWYNNIHPDFVWAPTQDTVPLANDDGPLVGAPLWNGRQPLDENWKQLAKQSAQKGQVLNAIVKSILNLSLHKNSHDV